MDKILYEHVGNADPPSASVQLRSYVYVVLCNIDAS